MSDDASTSTSAEDLITCDRVGTTATIRLARPAKRNAMTVGMWRRLAGLCAELASDRQVRAVVVTGAGPSFCSGADVSALTESDATLKAVVGAAEVGLRALPVPTVAAIRGHCWGGGMQIAVACDLRIATTDASFAVPPARLGVVYPAASLRAMTALVGPGVTKRMIFTGDPISAADALRVGLLEQVVEPDDLTGAVDALVAACAPRSLLSQSAAKAVVNAMIDEQDAERVYQRFQAEWAASGDGREGPAAFLAKRSPEYRWHPADLPDSGSRGQDS